jgi:hypothetical protein
MKIGRNWVTKKEWLEDYSTQEKEASNYVSLQEAVKYCNYSQEYLSLRARQGKLKAMKIGRNWVTKKEWLEDYLGQTEGYNKYCKEHLKIETISSVFSPAIAISDKGDAGDVGGEKDVCGVLPDHKEEKEIIYRLEFAEHLSLPAEKRTPFIRFALVSSLFLIIISSIILAKKPIIRMDMDRQIIAAGSVLEDTVGIFEEYAKWLGQKAYYFAKNLKKIPEKIAGSYKLLTTQEKEKESLGGEMVLPQAGKKGMVVIPSTEKDEEIKEKIKLSFSDEVKVRPADKSSGIIVPVFRSGEGEEYMYILVPIKN